MTKLLHTHDENQAKMQGTNFANKVDKDKASCENQAGIKNQQNKQQKNDGT